MARKHNYYAGPAALPQAVMEEAQKEFLEYQGSGVSIMETSHRSKEFDQVHNEAIDLIKEHMSLGDNYKVLFLQGGASSQFAMIPMNLLGKDKSADYVVTGAWSQKAIKEANIIATGRVAATTEKDGVFTSIPTKFDFDPNAVYCHLTSNNTIFGTQYKTYPDTGDVPLVMDMSSDIMCRKIDPNKFGIIYAGAQKNLGPAGVAVVIIRDDMLEKCVSSLPTILSYGTHVSKNSLFNTPPTYSIYMINKVLKWIKASGGVEAIQKINEEKGRVIYGAIDGFDGFYKNVISADDRSLMNVVFNLKSDDLEKKFVSEALEAGFIGVKGHRSVGGIRASIYNATPLESVQEFAKFMKEFAQKN